MTTLSVDVARRRLAEAQDELDRAEAKERFEARFPVQSTIYLVIARKPSFDQWVSYSTDGIPMGSFSSEQDAESYRENTEAPSGYDLLVEPLELRGRI